MKSYVRRPDHAIVRDGLPVGLGGTQMVRIKRILATGGAALASLALSSPATGAEYGACRFNSETLRFVGSVSETAACLLRRVRPRGSGADRQEVPQWLLSRVMQPVPFDAEQLESYLQEQGAAAEDLTGRIAVGDRPQVRYFVIHDTSSPEIPSSGTTFPPNIDQAGAHGNRLTGWGRTRDRVNMLITRDGRSAVFRDWGSIRPLAATKVEMQSRVPSAKPLFVHVENVQPRIKPPGSWAWRAPSPGLSPAQEQRLALAYVVASARAGRWLIPAYHFNIDQGLPDAHDDPQNADLASWVRRIQTIEEDILRD